MPQSPSRNRAFCAGLRYERRALQELRRHFDQLQPKPWFEFEDANGRGWASPDALVHQGATVVIIEIKLTHSLDAERQLLGLYAPLARSVWPASTVRLLSVVRGVVPSERAQVVDAPACVLDPDFSAPLAQWLYLP